MAPAIGALVGGGVVELWALRARNPRLPWAGLVLAGGMLATAATAWLLLSRTPAFVPGLAIGVAALAVAVSLVVLLPARLLDRRVQLVAIALGVAVLLAGPAAYALDTMATGYSGGDPSAGPQVASADGGGPGNVGGGAPNGGFGPSAGRSAPNGGAPNGGGDAPSSALTTYLAANRGAATWIVAVTSANQAGSIELATGLPVMAMGGFTGSDPAPTLAELQAMVASGQLRYVIVGGAGGGPGGGNSTLSAINAWVQANGTIVSSVSSNLYDLAGTVTTGT
jgi:hypothetical protein